ncbi:MAG: hypothetical protein AAF945_08460 [Actinomycetota bacterium]
MVLGAAPVGALVAIGIVGDWTTVGGSDSVAAGGGMDSGLDDAGDSMSIAIPLPDPATLDDAPRPPQLDPSVAGVTDAELVSASREADAAWHAASPASRSLLPALVPADVRGQLDVIPASVRVVGVDDVTISFRTESGLTGHAVGAGSIEDTVVPLFFLADRDETVRVVASSVRGESVVAAIPLADVIDGGGLDVTGSDLGSIDVRPLDATETADRLAVTVGDLDDYRSRHLTL